MERNTCYYLSGAMLLLSLSSAVALGQSAPPPAKPGTAGSGLAPAKPLNGIPGTSGQFNPFSPAGLPGTAYVSDVRGTGLPMTPELGKKTMSVLALREMLALHITAKDLSAALSPLKDLHRAERTLQTRTEQILEEEKRALLAADPDAVAPEGSDEKLRTAMEEYRRKQNEAWNSVANAIGREKAEGLRRLVDGGRFVYGGIGGVSIGSGIGKGGGIGGGIGGGKFAPSIAPSGGIGGGKPPIGTPKQPGQPPQPDDPTARPEAAPDAPSIPGEAALGGISLAPAGDLAPEAADPTIQAPDAPIVAQGEGIATTPQPPAAVQGGGIAVPQAPAAAQGAGAVTPAAPGVSVTPNPRGRVTPAQRATSTPTSPRVRVGKGQQSVGSYDPFVGYYAPPRMTLSELIDLMEQKLNAMKH